jgi:hypothetical protein
LASTLTLMIDGDGVPTTRPRIVTVFPTHASSCVAVLSTEQVREPGVGLCAHAPSDTSELNKIDGEMRRRVMKRGYTISRGG